MKDRTSIDNIVQRLLCAPSPEEVGRCIRALERLVETARQHAAQQQRLDLFACAAPRQPTRSFDRLEVAMMQHWQRLGYTYRTIALAYGITAPSCYRHIQTKNCGEHFHQPTCKEQTCVI